MPSSAASPGFALLAWLPSNDAAAPQPAGNGSATPLINAVPHPSLPAAGLCTEKSLEPPWLEGSGACGRWIAQMLLQGAALMGIGRFSRLSHCFKQGALEGNDRFNIMPVYASDGKDSCQVYASQPGLL